jgi:hypothetical protein
VSIKCGHLLANLGIGELGSLFALSHGLVTLLGQLLHQPLHLLRLF